MTARITVKIDTLDEALRRRHEPPEPVPHGRRTSDYEALLAITDRIATRFRDPTTFRRLTHGEQIVYTLGFELDAEVQNGGFHQYLSNSSGDSAEQAKHYLREVGAEDVLALLERVSAVFGGGVVPSDRAARADALDRAEEANEGATSALFDAATAEYYRCEKLLYQRLMGYVESHREDFAQPDDAAVEQMRKRSR